MQLRADLLFRGGDYTKAVGHFQELLRKKPGMITAIMRKKKKKLFS